MPNGMPALRVAARKAKEIRYPPRRTWIRQRFWRAVTAECSCGQRQWGLSKLAFKPVSSGCPWRRWRCVRHRRILADDRPQLQQALTTADPHHRRPTLAVQRVLGTLHRRRRTLRPTPLAVPTGQYVHWRDQRQELDGEQEELFDAAFQILDRSSPLRLGRPLSWQPP